MAATFKLSDTYNFVSPMVNFYPLSIGNTGQPFFGLCTAVAQVMLTPPFKHNWNRATVNFITTSSVQTYVPVNAWTASTSYTLGTTIIDSNGNAQKVITAGTSGAVAPAWATGIFLTTDDFGGSPATSLTWQNMGPIASIPQVTNFSFIEKAMVQDVNNGNVWKELGISLDLPRDTTTSCPKYVSAQTDDNLGDIAFRLTPPPGSAYPVSIQYQMLQTPFTSMNTLWAPIPDRLFYTYSFGVLALAYLYKGDSRYEWANMQFITRMLSYMEGMDESQINQFMRNWQGTQTETVWTLKAQQGVTARGQS